MKSTDAFKNIIGTFLGLVLVIANGYAQTEDGEGSIVIPDYITTAVNSNQRSDEDKARDPGRKPAEILALSGIKPGDKVVEFAGFFQYYSTLLSAIIGEEGELHVYDLPYTEQFAGKASRAFAAAHANITYHQVDYNEAELPDDVDVVFNVLYYHDLLPNKIDRDALNKKIFAALKPGGIFFVIDHKAEEGSGWRDAATIHRMETDLIKQEVTAAGFELAQESDLLAHPEDDHTKMVFEMRGQTDRSIFVFRKPE